MKQLVIGILAHVDAGKTTLSEALLYTAGAIPALGRVDHRDAYLDTHALERDRGITIFSKQALFQTPELAVTLLDTPGHVDFSAEMERTLQVLDYAILVISATDGVQATRSPPSSLSPRWTCPTPAGRLSWPGSSGSWTRGAPTSPAGTGPGPRGWPSGTRGCWTGTWRPAA